MFGNLITPKGIAYELRKLLKKPFKVGIVTYYYPSKREKSHNGVGVHAFYLSRKLAEMGCEIHIFSKADKEYVETEYIGEGKIVVHRITTNTKTKIADPVIAKRMSYFLFDNKIVNGITDENNREPFNVIHTHGWLTSGAFIAKYLNGLKWVHTFHSLEKNRLSFMSQEEKKYFNVAKWVESTINNADALISVSDNLKKETIEGYSVKEENFYTIPNGVDLNLFKKSDENPNDKRILYMGRFSLEKGIDNLPGIIKNVLSNNKEVKFEVLAPYITEIPSMKKIIKELKQLEEKYGERMIWHKEKKSREEMHEMITKCIICIQPSKYEAFGMTVLEAMACGKVPIVSNRGGLPEVVGNAGIVIPLDKNRFSEEILELVKNYRLRERYARRAMKRAQNFDWGIIAEKTLLVYKKTCGKLKKGEDKYGITESAHFRHHSDI